MNQRFSLRPFFANDPAMAALWQRQSEKSPVFLSWDWQRAMASSRGETGPTLVLMRGEQPLALLSYQAVRRHGILPVRQWHLLAASSAVSMKSF